MKVRHPNSRRRAFGLTLLAAAGLFALGACTQSAPATPKAGETGAAGSQKADIKLNVPQTINQAQASPAAGAASPVAAAKSASPTGATAARVEPKGKMTYAWHTAISPAWLDPSENPALITVYAFDYALHDAVVKHMPGKPLSPSLAESYEVTPDFKTATFKLRDGIKFHDGSPVTAEDVKFTFENYKGANAKVLKDKTASIETPDPKTVIFKFKEAFPDFMIIYGSPASGAGWVLPKKYYEQVGPDGFKQKPIGAGPYKFVRQSGGTEFEFEAFTDYWRKTPNVKTLVIKAVTEDATRIAQIQTGEADFMNLVPGALIETVKADPNLTIAGVQTSPFFLEFPGYEQADSPFNNPKVRQAVSLALDRKAISAAEEGGLSGLEGNWMPSDWPQALKRPMPEYNLAKAKELMAEAGYPNGFDGGQITPLPPYFSLAERVATSLREIGIRVTLNTMERAAFASKLAEGQGAFKGIILNISGAPGDAAGRVRAFAICPPKGASSRTCDAEIDAKFAQYEASADAREREKLITEIQERILDNHIFVPVYRQALVNVQGPRVLSQPTEIWGSIPQYVYVGPYEDVQVKD